MTLKSKWQENKTKEQISTLKAQNKYKQNLMEIYWAIIRNILENLIDFITICMQPIYTKQDQSIFSIISLCYKSRIHPWNFSYRCSQTPSLKNVASYCWYVADWKITISHRGNLVFIYWRFCHNKITDTING